MKRSPHSRATFLAHTTHSPSAVVVRHWRTTFGTWGCSSVPAVKSATNRPPTHMGHPRPSSFRAAQGYPRPAGEITTGSSAGSRPCMDSSGGAPGVLLQDRVREDGPRVGGPAVEGAPAEHGARQTHGRVHPR